jgi:hypothetical protein
MLVNPATYLEVVWSDTGTQILFGICVTRGRIVVWSATGISTYVQFGIAHTKNLECVHLPK